MASLPVDGFIYAECTFGSISGEWGGLYHYVSVKTSAGGRIAMHEPSNTHTGRAMLLFAALMLGLALWIGLGRGQWADTGLWFGLAGFFACYGGLMDGAPERWHRLLLIAGLASGVVAFVFAVRMAGLFP
jgi:hypothetical protein